MSKNQISPDVRATLQALQTIALFPNITTKWPAFVLSVFQFYSLSVTLFISLRFPSSNLISEPEYRDLLSGMCNQG